MILNLEKLKSQLGGIQGKLNYDIILPFVKVAEREFRKNVGSELYDFLNEADFSDESENDVVALQDLIEITQGCIAWEAYDLALPHMKFRVGDLGIVKTLAAGTSSVSKWEYADTRDANLAMVDLMWEFFWEAMEKVRPEVWVQSEGFQRRNQYFIRSADELTSYVALVGRNRRLFFQLEKFIKRSEQLYIAETITPAIFEILKTKWRTPSTQLSAIEIILVEKIREALAYFTLYEAYPYLPIKMDENGLREVRKWDGVGNETTAGQSYRDAQRQQLWQDAQLYLAKLKMFMDQYSSAIQFSQYYTANILSNLLTEYDYTDSPLIIL